MKFSTPVVSSLLLLGLSSTNVLAAPVAGSSSIPLETRGTSGAAAAGARAGRTGRAGKAIGTTVLGSTVAATLGTTLACFQNNGFFSRKCFGRKPKKGKKNGRRSVGEEGEDDVFTTLEARGSGGAAAGARAGRTGRAGKAIGTTVLGSTVAATLGTTLACFQNNGFFSRKCFGRKPKKGKKHGRRSEEAEEVDNTEDERTLAASIVVLEGLMSLLPNGTLGTNTTLANLNTDATKLKTRSPGRVGAGAKSGGKLAGTTVLGSLISPVVASRVACLAGGGGRTCFGFKPKNHKKKGKKNGRRDVNLTEQEETEILTAFGQQLESLMSTPSGTTGAISLQARDPKFKFGKWGKKGAGALGSNIFGGAVTIGVTKLNKCLSAKNKKACFKSIFHKRDVSFSALEQMSPDAQDFIKALASKIVDDEASKTVAARNIELESDSDNIDVEEGSESIIEARDVDIVDGGDEEEEEESF